jgi:hypothetical protein
MIRWLLRERGMILLDLVVRLEMAGVVWVVHDSLAEVEWVAGHRIRLEAMGTATSSRTAEESKR